MMDDTMQKDSTMFHEKGTTFICTPHLWSFIGAFLTMYRLLGQDASSSLALG